MIAIRVADSDNRWQVGTVYCLGKNYRDHAIEMGQVTPRPPVVFESPTWCSPKKGSWSCSRGLRPIP